MNKQSAPEQSESSHATPSAPFSHVEQSAQGPETVIKSGVSLPPDNAPSLHESPIERLLFPSATDGPSPVQRLGDGLMVGHFWVQARIGFGGMGAVFRAIDTRLQRTIALKVLNPSASRDPSLVLRFQSEGRATARLDHDSIAGVHFIGEDQGLHFIAYEYIDGINLRDLIAQRGRLGSPEAINYAIQVAWALVHIESRGVVHRDIKPSNVIVTSHGRAKVVDLGLARRDGEDSIRDLTVAGTTLGTFDYISPEQARDPRGVDIRSDIYSLGCTLYHMLTGEPPYPDGTATQKLLDHQRNAPPDPRLRSSSIPENLAQVVMRMMASDINERYPTPRHVIHDLMRIASGMGMRGLNPESLIWTAQRAPKRAGVPARLGGIMAGLLLLGGVAWLSQHPQDLTRELRIRTDRRSMEKEEIGVRVSPADAAETLPGDDQFDDSRFKPSVGGTEVPSVAESINSPVNADGIISPARNGNPVAASPGTRPADREPGIPTATIPPDLRPGPFDGYVPFLTGRNLPDPMPDVGPVMNSVTTDVATPSGRPTAPPLSGPTDDPIAATVAERDAAEPVGTLNPLSSQFPPLDQLPEVTLQAATGGSPQEFRTLEAACFQARSGDVVVLRYNGIREGRLPERLPIRLNGKKITLRGAEGFSPVVRFEPESTSADADTRLVTLSESSSLTISNVELQVVLPDRVRSELWSLFSLEGSQRVDLRDSVVRFINASGQRATLFEFTTAGNTRFLPDREAATAADGEFEVRISGSFISGSINVFTIANTVPGKLEATDSALLVDGTVLDCRGNTYSESERGRVQLRMEHTTCLAGDSLIRMTDGDPFGDDPQRRLLPVHVLADNNIFASMSLSPLIAMTGKSRIETFQRLIDWNGNKNIYDLFEFMWQIDSAESSTGAVQYRFPEWREYWATTDTSAEHGAVTNRRIWRNDEWQRRLTESLAPGDLELNRDASIDNPAILSATDGRDIGADLTRIPVPRAARSTINGDSVGPVD